MFCLHESSPGRWWDERFLGKFVGFFFLFLPSGVIKAIFEESVALVVQQDVPQFVEQTEPENIRPASPDGHHQNGLVWGEPEGCAIGVGLDNLWNQNDLD